MSFVAFSSFARKARSASRVGVGSALWIALNETWVLLPFRLEVDEAHVRRTAAGDEVERAEIADRHDGARASDRREDGLAVHERAHGPTQVLSQRIREAQRRVLELSEREGRTSH